MIKDKLLIQAYRKVCNYSDDVDITPAATDFSRRIIEEYNLLDTIDLFENTQSYFLPKPVNSAKQIALNAAVAIMDRAPTRITFNRDEKAAPWGSHLVEMAETIYQWLTEPVTDKR